MDQLDELLTCRLDLGKRIVEPCSIVIFGASGDLTSRKLIPALYHLYREGRLPEPVRIVGFARREKGSPEWRNELRTALGRHSRTGSVEPETWERFARLITYCRGDISDAAAYIDLARHLQDTADDRLRNHLLFYLAVAPSHFTQAVEHLSATGLLRAEEKENVWSRLIVEKPFGHDRDSARKLNNSITRHVREKQVFRIDHYLGKETVQNILLFRFSNAIFEQLWSRQSIDHVQITVSEKLGVGSRGAFYEEAGALRDIVQNHLLQVLALVTMEPPVSLEAESIRDEKVKLLKAIRPVPLDRVRTDVVRGQYVAGQIDGEPRVGYREEVNVDSASNVETYVALRLMIDNWRWAGVPFFCRTGKGLAETASEVRVQFRPTPHVLFAAQCGPRLDANALTLRLQPDEGISLRFNGKVPGASMKIRPVRMHFGYDAEFGAYTPEAYERLLLESIAGDPTLFIRRDEVEAAWEIIDPIRSGWSGQPLTEADFYPAGCWGPAMADALLAQSSRAWRHPHH